MTRLINLARKMFQPRTKFVPPVPMLASCQECRRLILLRAANRVVAHLIHDHKVEERIAYPTVDWVFAQMYKYTRRIK